MFNYLYGLMLALVSTPLFAQETTINEVVSGLNLPWILFAGALVFLMQAGFGLLESGMSRSKNSVNATIQLVGLV